MGRMPFPGDRCYQIDGVDFEPHDIHGPVFHNTQLKNLLQGNACTSHESGGIVRDGGLSWGTCTHNGKSGVNYNTGTNGGAWTFNGVPATSAEETWIALECHVTASSKLKGGATQRYCITRAGREDKYGPVCPFIGIRAILMPLHDVPNCVRLT